MNDTMEAVGIFSAMAFLFAVGFWVGHKANNDDWLKRKEPYCEESTAKVRDKSLTIRRCWKVIEVNDA